MAAPPPQLTPGTPVYTDVYGGGTFVHPSCPTTTFCAVGQVTGDVQMWNGKSWEAPTLVDRTDPYFQPQLTVSCPTTTLCVGVDVAGNAFLWRGSAWTGPTVIDTAAGDGIQQLSCATATFCAALDHQSRLMVFNGATWSTPTPTGIQVNPLQLTCVAPTTCMVLNEGDSYVYNGTRWRGPIQLDPGGDDGTNWTDVSCASPTYCFASGYAGNVAFFNGTQWAAAGTPNAGLSLGAIQCPTVGFCAVEGGYQDDSLHSYFSFLVNGAWQTPIRAAVGGGLYAGFVCRSATFCIVDPGGGKQTVVAPHTTVWNGRSWQTPAVMPVRPGGLLSAVDCASTTFCAAVDNAGNAQILTSGAWTAPTPIDPAPSGLTDVSCPSSTFCMAVDGAGGVMQWNGTGWRGPTDIDGDTGMSSIDCPTTVFCIATSGSGDAVRYNGTSWSPPTQFDPQGDVVSVSCPTATFCAADDIYGNVFTFNGTMWSAPTFIAVFLDNVSCASPTFCVADVLTRNPVGEVAFYNGRTWSSPVVIDPGAQTYLVTCASTTSCVAVDGNNALVSFNRAGANPPVSDTPAGSIPLSPSDITCPTVTSCLYSYPNGIVPFSV